MQRLYQNFIRPFHIPNSADGSHHYYFVHIREHIQVTLRLCNELALLVMLRLFSVKASSSYECIYLYTFQKRGDSECYGKIYTSCVSHRQAYNAIQSPNANDLMRTEIV